jgi:competence protein ComEC
VGAALLLLLGVAAGLLAVEIPSIVWIGAAVALSGATLARRVWRYAGLGGGEDRPDRHAVLLSLALMGCAVVFWQARAWYADRVAAAEIGERFLVRGEIVGVPERSGDEWRLVADVAIVVPRDRAGEPKRRLILTSRNQSVHFAAHEQWQWLVQIAPVPQTRGDQDPMRWWFRDGVHGAARIIASRLNRRLRVAPLSIDGMRERVAVGVHRNVIDRDAAALVLALAVGLTDSMSREQWRVFNATGTTHLVAISGMHVTLFAWLAFRVARSAWGWLPGIWRRLDREPFALALGVAAAGAYALLAGFSVPTQRTLAMLAVFAVARLSRRAVSSWRVFAVALIAVLAVDPLAPLGAGFWLSFAAVAAILLIVSGRMQRIGAVAAAGRVQLGVLLALVPVSLAIFGSVSLASIIVNAVAIPVFSFVLVPLALIGACTLALAPDLAAVPFGCAEWVYHTGWPWLAAAADWPFALWQATPSVAWYLLGAVACLLALLPGPLRIRISAIAVLFPLWFAPGTKLPSGVAVIELHDTGRGVLALIETSVGRVIYDTGDSYDTRGRFLERLVPAWLQRTSGRVVDTLVLPRVSADRAAGVGRLIATVPVQRVLGGGEWRGAVPAYERCHHGAQWRSGGVLFETWLGADGVHEYCALRVGEGAGAVLLAAEFNLAAEHDALRRMVLSQREPASNWVLVGRRGSPSASSDEWIEALRAQVALVPAPWASGANRARAATLARWRNAHVQLLRLDSVPSVSIQVGPGHATTPALVSATSYPFLWRRSR